LREATEEQIAAVVGAAKAKKLVAYFTGGEAPA
jgi:hypothetical protein